VFISQNGMVQRTAVKGISRYGRASQGVKLMNLREDDRVSAVALVVEDSPDTAAQVEEDPLPGTDAGEATMQPPELDPAPESGADGSEEPPVADSE
jgi:DNA gyrase subunit A